MLQIALISVSLDSSVGRACWCVWTGWPARQSRTPDQTCQRVRSALTQWVRGIEGGEANVHKDFRDGASGQLRNLGSCLAPFPNDAGNLGNMAHASHDGRQMRPMGDLNGEMEQREQTLRISIHRDMLDI